MSSPSAAASPLCRLDQHRREVDRRHRRACLRRLLRDRARPGRQVEPPLPRLRGDPPDDHVVGVRERVGRPARTGRCPTSRSAAASAPRMPLPSSFFLGDAGSMASDGIGVVDARGTLRVGNETLRDLPARRAAGAVGRRAAAVHAARPARERAPRAATSDDAEADRRLGRDRRAEPRDLLPPEPRPPPGLHRRPGDRRPRGDAERDAGPRRQRGARSTRSIPAELVIDHSVQVDEFATKLAFGRNVELEFERNRERYAFLRWGQGAFADFKVVPPGTGIVHQVNLEYLARVVESRDGQAFPDTLVGTDSHTTMVNGLGVLGWGVGGIEAEAAMLGEALSMLVPQVVGFRLTGALPEGATATDLVLTVTETLRKTGVVGKFVEYFGPGLAVALARRPRDAREHVARVRRDLRLLPGRRRDAPVPAPDRPARTSASPSSRRTARRTCSGTTPTTTRPTRRSSSSTSARSSRASPGRAARRTACRCATRSTRSCTSCRASASTTATRRTRRSRRASPPPTRPRTSSPATRSRPAARPRRRGRRAGACARPRRARRRRVRARPRLRRDRRDHELHEHLEPAGDGRRRPARQEGGRARARPEAVGEVEPRARLARRHRLLREGRPDAVPRGARLPHRRLRLHDLHRELRAAARGDLGRRDRDTTSSSAPSSPATATSRRASTPR